MPQRLLNLLARLRHPETGCPWDRQQTPLSLCTGIIDEAYELVDAIEQGRSDLVAEELGDLLFQLMFIVSLYERNDGFTLEEVVQGVESKMIRRHPHVFGEEKLHTTGQVLNRWEQIKLSEKPSGHPLDSVPRALPALAQARRLWSKSKRLGWLKNEDKADLTQQMDKVMREKRPDDFAQLLFALVIWGMDNDLNAEELLRAANFQFREKIKASHPATMSGPTGKQKV